MLEKVLYVAGPMSGRPDLNYPMFNSTQARLEKVGFRVLNPADIDEQFRYIFSCQNADRRCGGDRCEVCGPDKRDWQWYMRKAIPMVCQADGICVLPGWQESRGARLETDLARSVFRMRILFADGWERRAATLGAAGVG